MKDPKIIELVKQFNEEVAALNKTWSALHAKNVWVRIEMKGVNSYTEEKYLHVDKITESVDYLKDEKNVG